MVRTGDAAAPRFRASRRRSASLLVERAREAFKRTRLGRSTARTIAARGVLAPRAGHYYSPIPSLEDVRRDHARIFDRSRRELPGIDVDDAGQVELLEALARFYPEQPFTAAPDPRNRYHLDNSWFAWGDGLLLHLMLRYARPRRVVEVGSGFSSLVLLDTNERFFDNRVRLTLIEPNAERLRSRLRPGDAGLARVVERRVQDVDLALFREPRRATSSSSTRRTSRRWAATSTTCFSPSYRSSARACSSTSTTSPTRSSTRRSGSSTALPPVGEPARAGSRDGAPDTQRTRQEGGALASRTSQCHSCRGRSRARSATVLSP